MVGPIVEGFVDPRGFLVSGDAALDFAEEFSELVVVGADGGFNVGFELGDGGRGSSFGEGRVFAARRDIPAGMTWVAIMAGVGAAGAGLEFGASVSFRFNGCFWLRCFWRF